MSVKKLLTDEALRAREVYGDRLEISIGVELGEPHHDIELAGEIISDRDLDFVIGSLHHARGQQDYYYVDYKTADVDAVMQRYYDELEELAECGLYDVIGHINYQTRYMPKEIRDRTDLSRYYGRLRGVLEAAASLGKGIEVNSSGIWRGIGITLPSPEVTAMFRASGGRTVTTGSDAHSASNVGDGLPEAVQCLKDAGFSQFAFFRNKIPEFHEIT
jgi:histidinol-phosphatase (PHP family)